MATVETVGFGKSRYNLKNRVEIGKGTFGKVYKVLDTVENKYVAIKAVSNFEASTKEVELLQTCKSPYIVQLHGTFEQDFSVLIVLEYCKSGSLMNILKNSKNKSMTEMEIKTIMSDTLKGLKYLHNKNILHRDIKPDNILLGNDNNYKLTDFGVSKNTIFSTAKTQVGTPLYMAPELLIQHKYNNKCDIYSIGVTAIHLCVYSDPNIIKDIQHIETIKKDVNLLPTQNEAFREFIQKCIYQSSVKRLSSDQLLKCVFINNDNDEKTNVIRYKNCNECGGTGTISQNITTNTSKPKIVSYHPGTKQMIHTEDRYHPSPFELHHPGSINYINGNDSLDICDHEGFNYQKEWAQWSCCQERAWHHHRINKQMVPSEGCSGRRDCCGDSSSWKTSGLNYYGGCTWKCCHKKWIRGSNDGCQLGFSCCRSLEPKGCETKKV